jgi:hypothetical protein
MTQLVFLLEELSAKEFLDRLLPRLLPDGIDFLTIPHRGKHDLVKSIPIKLKAWQRQDARFVILHDQDSNDCLTLKQRLSSLCQRAAPHRPALVRISCRELEAWYWGDLAGVEKAYPNSRLTYLASKATYRHPDTVGHPADEIKKHVPEFEKVSGARKIAPHLSINQNRSASFNAFISGVRKFCQPQL